MSVVVTDETNDAEHEPGRADSVEWKLFTRLAFRFCFLYLGLFCTLMPPIVFVLFGWLGRQMGYSAQFWPVRKLQPALSWVSRHLFGTSVQLYPSGVGDQRIFWVLVFCVFVVSMIGTALWSVLDRRRVQHRVLASWYLLVVRLLLAGQMLNYGVGKMIPTQMPQPSLTTLLTKYGDLTPMAVLWSQVGVSRPYEMLLGAAEITAAVLLFIPKTTSLGALLALIDTSQILVLNMTFDVPEKILSAHLLLMSLVVLAPDSRRLLRVLLLNRSTAPAVLPYPFHTRRSQRIAAVIQGSLGLWIAVALVLGGWHAWRTGGPDRPKPPLYGIWSVSQYIRDGQQVPPLITDGIRWKTVVFDYLNAITYQRMDDTLVTVPAEWDAVDHRIRLIADTVVSGPAEGAERPENPRGTFVFQQLGPEKAVLTGELDGHQVTLSLDRIDLSAFPQRSASFHWMQDRPNL
ncbi:DoxX family protein [Nocardia sp. CDC160]|uniref:DoxX family protein n=1 Tax=Nocardia sp. CDC160 TaxID=3112166 RepID=UPI002DBD0B2E|nr:DoxX family protein [Nocardia sp. CDC160]MEC3919274.1 DoxX family protein [Nocardia sp. CDC160]